MQNATRMSSVVLTTGEAILEGAPVVVWAIADATVETVELKNTDGAGGQGSTNVVVHSFTATAPIVSFPFGIQMKEGVSMGAGDVTIFYTKI